MDKRQITKIIENYAPLSLAEIWDCSGWLVETELTDVKSVMLCLTVTDNIVEQALNENCDMIISHHPLFFVPIKYKGINIYCAHTNLDKTDNGTTDKLIDKIFNPNCQNNILSITKRNEFARYVTLKEAIDINNLSKELLKLTNNLRLVNNTNIKHIKEIGLCAGSGSEFITDDVDVFITGDVKFHTASESKVAIYDIGHFESEIMSLEIFEKLLNKYVKIIYANEKSPFNTLTIKF